MKYRNLVVVCLAVLTLPFAAPAQTPQACTAFDDVAILATNSILLQREVQLTGDVIANDQSPGPVIDEGAEVALDRSTVVTGKVKGDTVDLDSGAAATGGVECNNGSAVTCLGLSLPVFDPLPKFETASIRPGAVSKSVADGETLVLGAGEYGDITIAQRGTLILTGGLYQVRSILAVTTAAGQCPFPCRQLLFDAPTDLRVEGRFDSGLASKVGPSGAGASASDIIVYVGGANGGSLPLSLPRAAVVGRGSTADANFYVPNGTFNLERQSTMSGAVIARDVMIDRLSTFTEDTFFLNKPPVANDQVVNTGNAASVVVTLTGSDPDGGGLTFEFDVPTPTEGAATNLVPIVPAAVQRCSVSAGACSVDPDCPLAGETCDTLQPPVTSATFTYTPTIQGAEAEDSVGFKVTDECGLSDSATVFINPAGDPGDPGAQVVDANDVSVDTPSGTQVGIGLSAGGPPGAILTFSVESLPSGGTLEDSGGNPISAPLPYPLPDNQVFYTPNAGTVSDSFLFSATDGVTSDTATVTIGVGAPLELAPDRQVTTGVDTPLLVTLVGNPGGSGTPIGGGQAPQTLSGAGFGSGPSGGAVTMQAPVAIDATVAWNVADADVDGFGDESNADNPSWPATPALVSAAVGSVGGPGTNGTARIHIEFDISDLLGPVSSATVDLATVQGTTDSLDTFFFTGNASGNGTLENSDFETAATQLAGVVMPVSTAGSFSFDVSQQLQAAIDADFSHFVVQGRVDELFDGAARGLQVRTACATCGGADPPTLNVTTGEPNLTVTDFQAPATATVDDPIGDQILATVTNTGTAPVSAASAALISIGYYVSLDPTITTGDRLLSGGREFLVDDAPNGLAVGESVVITLAASATISSTFPDANPPLGDNLFIGVVVDESDALAESDENDNTASLPISVQAGATASLVWELTALPPVGTGTLRTLAGALVTVGQTFTTQPTLRYTPPSGFVGTSSIGYRVTQGTVFDNAVIGIVVTTFGDCLVSPLGCDDGRGGGGGGLAPQTAPPGSPTLQLQVEGSGAVAAAVFGVGHGRPTTACSGSCAAWFGRGETVILAARPDRADTEFVSWQGDCSGSRPLILITMDRAKRCVATFRTVER